MKKTILTTEKSFPYVKRRLEVIHTERVELTPLEVAILNMESKISDLKYVLNRVPCDTKLLQMQLQGGFATAVNQVYTCTTCVICLFVHLSLHVLYLSIYLSIYLYIYVCMYLSIHSFIYLSMYTLLYY